MTNTPLTRRALLGAAGVATVWSATSADALRGPLLPAARADQLGSSFGVGVHLNYRGTVYARHHEVRRWLRTLGVRHIRTRLSVSPDVLDAFAALSRDGIRIHAVCGAFGDDQPMDVVMSAVRKRFAHPERIFSAFEGINEPNNDGLPWIAETRAKTQELHAARQAYGLTGIPIVAPALASVTSGGVEGDTTLDQARLLGSLQEFVDVGNMHVYPRGLPPSSDIDYFRTCASNVTGSLPVMCTEGGYFTAMQYEGGARPVPESVAAAYAPQAVLEHWLAGTRRFFRYELLDEPDAGPTDREGTLGMIATSGGVWRPKQDFAPVRRLLAALHDPGRAYRPQAFPGSLTGAPADLRHAVFARRRGGHVLALWLDRPIYEPSQRRLLVEDLTAPITSVRLELGSRLPVKVVHLTDLGSPARRTTARRLNVRLTAGVTLVTVG